MPARKKPTKVLEASGAFRKNPQRKRGADVEVTDPIGNAPDHLTPEQLQAWKDIVSRAPDGVLTRADGIAVEMAACLNAEMMADFDSFTAAKLARLQALLTSFGMTPTSRAGLGISPTKKPDNIFAEF